MIKFLEYFFVYSIMGKLIFYFSIVVLIFFATSCTNCVTCKWADLTIPSSGALVYCLASKDSDTIYLSAFEYQKSGKWSFKSSNIVEDIKVYLSKGYKIDSFITGINYNSFTLRVSEPGLEESVQNFKSLYPTGNVSAITHTCDCNNPESRYDCFCCRL